MYKPLFFFAISLILTVVFSGQVLAGDNLIPDEAIEGQQHKGNAETVALSSGAWTEIPAKHDVHLTKSWTIQFSQSLDLDDIDGINIIKDRTFIPVEISIEEGNDFAKVTPVRPYKANSTYSVVVFLNNGNKYRMDFTTADYGDIEPNDTIDQAGRLKLNEPVEGRVIAGDDDYYLVDVPASGRLDIDISRYDEDNINLYFIVKDATERENKLISLEADQSGYYSNNQSSNRSFSIDVEEGLYYLKVSSGFSIDRSSNYSDGSSGNYRLTVDYTEQTIENDPEINDTIDQAVSTSVNTSNTGHIMYMRNDGSRDTTDYYQFEVPSSGELNIDLERYDNNNINLYLATVDDMNKEVIIAKEEADQDGYYSEGRASKRNISLDAEPGTYYIKVSAGFSIDRSSNYSNGSSGEYRLTIEHQ